MRNGIHIRKKGLNRELLVFCTSLQTIGELDKLGKIFNGHSGIFAWNVDLEDWESVLRLECSGVLATDIIEKLRSIGVFAREMPF